MLTQEEYEKRLKIIKKRNKHKKYKHALKEAKNSWKPEKEKMETSKQLAIYLFVVLNVVILYCLVAMWWFSDLSCLGILISDIAAQILLYGIYCLKAYKAKKSSENMKFKRERLQGMDELLNAGAESNETVPVNGDVTTFNSMSDVTEDDV